MMSISHPIEHPKRTRNNQNRFLSPRPQEPSFNNLIHFLNIFLSTNTQFSCKTE